MAGKVGKQNEKQKPSDSECGQGRKKEGQWNTEEGRREERGPKG